MARDRKSPISETRYANLHKKTAHDIALETKAKYDKKMKGVQTILVNHPTIPGAKIERIVKSAGEMRGDNE